MQQEFFNHMEYIQKWDQSWDNRKAGIVKHTIWKILTSKDTKQEIDKLLVTRDKIAEITKSPGALINELIKDKVLIKTELTRDTYLVNQKKYYCKNCEYEQQKDHELHQRELQDKSFFYWERFEHLIRFHGCTEERLLRDLNQENNIVDAYIKDFYPEFKIHDHDLEVIEISQPFNTQIEVNLKCKVCNEEFKIWRDHEPCSNYNKI